MVLWFTAPLGNMGRALRFMLFSICGVAPRGVELEQQNDLIRQLLLGKSSQHNVAPPVQQCWVRGVAADGARSGMVLDVFISSQAI